MFRIYLQHFVMMFSLVIDGPHRERIQLVECNLEEQGENWVRTASAQ